MSIDEYLRFNPRLGRERLMSMVQYDQREEDDMVARARGTSLLDGVLEFELFLDTKRRLSEWPGVRRLTRDEVFVGHDPEAVRQAQVRARGMLGDAERYGDEAHDQRNREPLDTPDEQESDVKVKMRRDHPGFSERSYTAVLMRSMFLMR